MKSDLRIKKKCMKQQGSGGKCGWSKKGQKIHKRLTDETVTQRKTGWRKQEERRHQEKFQDEMGLQPASMTMRLSANTEDADNKDSNSETEFGGEDDFEDHRSCLIKSV